MTDPGEAERVRGYLLAQANKLSLPELVAKVRTDCAPLERACDGLPGALFLKRPSPDDWSAAEVWTHVLETTDVFSDVIEAIIATGERPPGRQMVEGIRPGFERPGQFWEAYSRRREELYAAVLRARGDEHLDVKVNHPNFGDLSWREWLLFFRVHDLDHLRQLQTIVAAIGTGTGQL